MTRKVILILVASLVTAVLIGWAIVKLPRRATRVPPPAPAAAPAPLTPVIDGRKIKARLFFVSEDGSRLTSVEHEVPYAERTEMQARRILEAQFAPAAPPLVSAIPQGTTVRAVFLTPDGTAFVDVSGELASKHPGGSLNELLTVYTIVEALTTNLPAVTAVQLLVDGKELDTLAGHLDMKHPLPRGDEWVVESPAATR
ncbi:MAG: GerMN domain-containing protein [Vicinamibacterales bacterium]